MAAKHEASAVLAPVFASNRDRGADSAAPESEVKAEPEPHKAEADAEPVAEAEQPDSSKQYRDPETGRFVPLHELKTERTKRQEEARLREEAERRYQEAERRMADLERRFAQHQQPPQPPPDWMIEPDRAAAHFQQQMAQQLFETRVYATQEVMRSIKPDYDQAEEAFAKAAQQNQTLARQMMSHPNPAKFAYEQGKRIMAMERIGADPDAYEKRIREETRKQVLEELKKGPAQPQRFPGTLADGTASGAQGAILTDEAMMADVFASNRRSRVRA